MKSFGARSQIGSDEGGAWCRWGAWPDPRTVRESGWYPRGGPVRSRGKDRTPEGARTTQPLDSRSSAPTRQRNWHGSSIRDEQKLLILCRIASCRHGSIAGRSGCFA